MSNVRQKSKDGLPDTRRIDITICLLEIFSFIFSVGGIIYMWCWASYFKERDAKNIQGYGLNTYGDFIGGTLGPIWALVGIALIYIAFLGQKKQLMYQEQELKDTKLEMKEQNKTMKRQSFEDSFFQLLTLLDSSIESFSLEIRVTIHNTQTYKGQDVMSLMSSEYINIACGSRITLALQGKSEEEVKKIIMANAFDDLHITRSQYINQYLRVFNQILKFVDKSDIDDRQDYIDILNSKQSMWEQVLVYSFYLNQDESSEFRLIVDKYHVCRKIQDMSLSQIIDGGDDMTSTRDIL